MKEAKQEISFGRWCPPQPRTVVHYRCSHWPFDLKLNRRWSSKILWITWGRFVWPYRSISAFCVHEEATRIKFETTWYIWKWKMIWEILAVAQSDTFLYIKTPSACFQCDETDIFKVHPSKVTCIYWQYIVCPSFITRTALIYDTLTTLCASWHWVQFVVNMASSLIGHRLSRFWCRPFTGKGRLLEHKWVPATV